MAHHPRPRGEDSGRGRCGDRDLRPVGPRRDQPRAAQGGGGLTVDARLEHPLHHGLLLDVAGLRVTRSGRDLLHDVDLRVRSGEHWALLGPNGAGKSTLLAVLGATSHPTAGTVEVLGRRLGRVDVRELREHIGHVDPRHRMLSPLTVLETVLTGLTGTTDVMLRWEPTPEQVTAADQHIADVGLRDRRDARWPVLSQGERGRALIARALMSEPQLLLLDEPATGLDVAAREHLLETVDALRVRQPELGSVMVTHHLEDLPASTSHAMLLRDGAVVAAGPADEVITAELVSACFDFPLDIERSDGRWRARRRPHRTTIGASHHG